jgi:putative PEP-CTERM system TPR-repeat lipoprotein
LKKRYLNIKNKTQGVDVLKFNQVAMYLGFAVFISACGENITSQEHVVKAKSAIEKNELSTSEIELKNALKVDGKNAEARFLLGQLYLSQGNSLVAIKELERAHSLNYDANKVVPLLARAYLLAESYEDISNLSEDLEYLVIDSKIKYLAYKCIAAILNENFELGQGISQQLSALSKSSSYTLLANAYVSFAEKNNEDALSLVLKALIADPKNIDALLLKGHVSFAVNNFTQAAENYKQYEALQPKVGVTKLLIANSLLRDKKYDEAEKYADEILAIVSNQPVANYVKAIAGFEKNDFALAKTHAETALNENYNLPVLKLIAGASAYNLNNFESAHYHLNDIAKKLPPNHYARKILAISQLQLGLIEDINETLIGFSPTTSKEINFLSNLSYQLAELGALDGAKTLAKKATENAPELLAEQSVRNSVLKLMMSDPSGIEDLALALAATPNLEGAELAIAFAALQKGDYEKAVAAAERWQKKQPDISGSYNMLAAIYIAQKKHDLATKALKTSLTKDANNLFALTVLAKLNFNEGNKKEAEKFALRAVEQYPDNPRALRYYYASKLDEQSLAKIKQAYQKNRDNTALSLLYVDALINSKDLVQAFAISNAMESNIRTPKKSWLQRIAILKKQGDEPQLTNTIEKWLQANPYHIEPILLLADHYVKQRQADKALQYLDDALSDYHKASLILKIVKIQLLLDTNKLFQAKRLYQDQQFQSVKPELKSGIEGRIAFLEKDFIKAAKELAPFYKAYPTSQNALLLAVAQRKSEQADDAILTLKIYLDKNGSDSQVRSLLANFYLENRPEKSIPLYERVLLDNPKDIVSLNNLAWLNLEYGELEKALSYSDMAMALAPEHPNVIDTRGMVLLKSGKKMAAWKTVLKAYNLSKGEDNNIALNYAEILILNNELIEAAKVLLMVTSNSPNINTRKNSLLNLTQKNQVL